NAAIQHLMQEDNKLTITIQRKDKQELPQTLGGLISFVDNNDVKGRFFSNIKIDYRESSAIKPTYTDPIYWQLIITICLAFVGGVLLNFMPCVLPVLSIKILSIVNESNKTINQQKAASYTFGVLITFSSLAIILIVLKALGREIGWGFQLQSPVFVNILLYLMFAIGLNLSGVFSIGDAITALGDKWTKDKGMIGAFFTGMLATIVATPCTAPFMASAIGYALTQSNLVTLLIFLALAFGFSSPFLIITFIPSLEKVIPKPGAWMTTFKQLMAFPMYGASAWLLWIMAHQIEPIKLGFPLSGLILIAFAAWLSGQATEKQENSLVSRIGILIIMLLALILAIASGNNTEKESDQFITNSASERYSPAKLLTAKSARIPIFINYTAAWCITCKINELTVLSDETVQRTLREKGVLYLKADWTSADPTITRSIESFKRVGIPLYVLYDREGNYRILPQLLRKKTFINTIKSL
ncbi:MAG: thiol:disulfide interchange protein, partial [Rhodospirillaceae bacterium]|nr:thiol:disulfide interchange protein [Rhodospirillaceae bacterium]